ncbi:N-acetyltransferase family protein [Novosphingobium colocasiae]|uniref:GNAT family N-acetyltransferase n=1 Tax=Novosphingobium colocasiae TaxID=1256513 RepID=UPI0035AE605A
MKWTIRSAGAEDADALALVGAATFLDTYAGAVDGQGIIAFGGEHHSADAYRAYLAKGAQAWLAECEPGGAPIGYALTCAPELEQAGDGDVELKRIYVLSRFHGSGIAAGLLAAALAGSAGYRRLLLGVKNDNHRALAFYARHGFEQIGTRTFRVGDKHYDDFVLARALTPELTDTP